MRTPGSREVGISMFELSARPTAVKSPGNGTALIVLAVHSSTPYLAVALTEDRRILVEKVLSPGRRHLENLAPTIAEVMDRACMSLDCVDCFAVAKGPGSFSGIRVGMAVVKGMAFALCKPVVGISSLEMIAWQSLEEGRQGICVIDAKRGDIYAAIYRKEGGRVLLAEGPMLIPPGSLNRLIDHACGDLKLCGDPIVNDILERRPHVLRIPVPIPSAAACALLALERCLRGEAENPHTLVPLYIRRSDAEEKKAGEGRRKAGPRR